MSLFISVYKGNCGDDPYCVAGLNWSQRDGVFATFGCNGNDIEDYDYYVCLLMLDYEP